jgi:opacity protein-like surface antigen
MGAYGGREIEYRNLGVDLYSKFFFTKSSRLRPYIGAGFAFNRSTARYSNNQQNVFGGQNFGNEELVSSHISGQVMGGTEILFTKSIGMNAELMYSRGVGSSFSQSQNMNPFTAPDQQRLADLSDDLRQSNALSIYAGMLILF